VKRILTRDVTPEECPWLDETIKKGAVVVFDYSDCTYGCISDSGKAVSREEGKKPFFEIPRNALGLQ